MKSLPVSIAYPIWTAIGTLGTVILGYFFLGEALTIAKVVSAVAIGSSLRRDFKHTKPDESGYLVEQFSTDQGGRLTIWRHPQGAA